ncbi:MAG: polysaccharide biosynthesis tyrosine autokinase, partial [Chitinophagaceae bacterium]|nr:polysaccharide biosynthesis tyrosine autokinase [Chitinophagaceae bacterium]
IYKKGKFRPEPVYTQAPVKIKAKNPATIVDVEHIALQVDAKNAKVLVDGQAYPVNKWAITRYGDLKFEPTSYFGKAAGVEYSFSLHNPKLLTGPVQQALKVESVSKLSSILTLRFKDEIPERGEDILNTLLAAYNSGIASEKNMLAANTLNFVEDRLANIAHDLDSIEREVQQYRAQKGAIDISTQGRLFLENVSSNDQKLSDVNMQLSVLNQVENYVLSKNGSEGIVPSTLGVNDATLSNLVSKLYTAELEYESLRKTTAENNPMLQSLKGQIDKIKPGILENIRNQRRSLVSTRSNLSTTNSSYASVLREMPEQERQLIDINRQQSIKSEIYTFLLQKREETALSYASNVAGNRVIDKASSTNDPVSPKKKLVYLISIAIAVLIGIGLVTGKETLNRKIMFRQEIESLTSYPIIGEIATTGSKEQIVIGEGKKTFIAEQFRRLRATLQFIDINSRRKRVLVTSSIAGEGKSFVATNVALTMALSGKKVVLLDFDLNNPSLSHKLNLYPSVGISEYLNDACTLSDIINTTPIHKNLFFISSGKLPENPTELIMNGKAEELLNDLDGSFDYIIIDTPPVSPVTDAYLLSPYCDGTLYVIRHGYTPKVFVERIDENNRINKLNNVGIVFNGVQPRGFGKRNYGYGYGYGYIHQDKAYRKRLVV